MAIGHYNEVFLLMRWPLSEIISLMRWSLSEVILLMRWSLSEVSLYFEIGFALLITNNELEVLHNHLVQTNVFV